MQHGDDEDVQFAKGSKRVCVSRRPPAADLVYGMTIYTAAVAYAKARPSSGPLLQLIAGPDSFAAL